MENDEWRVKVESQIVDLTVKVDANTEITEQTKERVDEVYEVLLTLKGAFKAMGWLAKAAQYLSYLMGLGSAVWLIWYQATHDGNIPPPDIRIPK